MATVSRTTDKHGPDDDGPEDGIPPLETGDRLSRAEFERRYRAMPGLKRAELIEGVVYMPTPVRLRRHGGPHFDHKLKVYRRNGVCEYVVWRVLDRQVDWFVLREGDYVRLPLDASGVYRSEVFPGLWLDPSALVGGDMAAVLVVTRSGLASPEHATFVARLNAQPKSYPE
jgi:hypothetical protein